MNWKYKNFNINCKPDLCLAGIYQASSFVSAIKMIFPKTKFESAFEWCGGAGFIGFSLLAECLVKHLCIADINPAALACVEKTVKANKLSKKVTHYVSDNFNNIPQSKKFDLIVGNPPGFCNLNPRRKGSLDKSLRLLTLDENWKIHKKFYSQVHDRLLPNGIVLLHEIEPFQTRVYTDASEISIDLRPRPPILEFKKMIKKAGLKYIGCIPMHELRYGWLVISQKS